MITVDTSIEPARCKLTIPLYNVDIEVCISRDLAYCKKHIESKYKGVKFQLNPNATGIASEINCSDKKVFLLFLKVENWMNIDHSVGRDNASIYKTVAHESLHLSYWICDYLGIKVDSKNHEAQAYIMDNIFSQVLEVYHIYTNEQEKAK